MKQQNVDSGLHAICCCLYDIVCRFFKIGCKGTAFLRYMQELMSESGYYNIINQECEVKVIIVGLYP